MGLAGIISVLVSNGIAWWLGYHRKTIEEGIYGYNALLTGLAAATYFAASWQAVVLVVIISILTFFVTVVLQGVFSKYGMPFLGIPFLLVVWLLILGFPHFTNLGINVRDIYTANSLYSIGGLELVRFFDKVNNLPLAPGLKTYFLSLGAIFFQYNVLAGIVIAVGLLIFSRQAFLMSLVGFYAAYGFYIFLGVPVSSLNYTYFGFNFILSAIAIGSYFIVPSFKSFLWTLLLIPVLVIVTIGSDGILSKFMLPVLSLPFNIVVFAFVYSLKIRMYPDKQLKLTYIQHKNPERNVYFDKVAEKREYLKYGISFSLPFYGKWSVSQGYNGKYTHKDAWRHALDFIIVDAGGKQYRGTGDNLTDYYCYDKPVVAVADGTVVEVVDNIEDNRVGDVNLDKNWGNTVIIQHGIGIYSQYSHLKAGSIAVTKGMYVKRGQLIANVGNSGRSPYPHLHFQFQSSNIVGSKTIELEFNDYLRFKGNKAEFLRTGIPQEGDTISNVEPLAMMQKAFKFVPGTKFAAAYTFKKEVQNLNLTADVDIYNYLFLANEDSGEKLYISANQSTFKALSFVAGRKSPIRLIYNSLYFVPLSYYENTVFTDYIPVHINHNPFLVTLQDFFVNFMIFLKTEYSLEFEYIDNDFNPSEIRFTTIVTNYFFNKRTKEKKYAVTVKSDGTLTIEDKKFKAKEKLVWERKD